MIEQTGSIFSVSTVSFIHQNTMTLLLEEKFRGT